MLMKAKKLIGVVAGAALTMSTVFGSAMPVFADVVEAPTVETSGESATPADQTAEPSADPVAETQTGESQGAETQTGESQGAETQVVPEAPVTEPEVTQQEVTQPDAETQEIQNEPVVGETLGEANDTDTQDEGTGGSDSNDTDTETNPADLIGSSLVASTGGNGLSLNMMNPFSDDEGQSGIGVNSLAESEAAPVTEPAFTGIEINGDFTQWDSVEKTTVEDGNVKNLAMVFDKDVYIYIEGEDVDWGQNDIATGAGVHNDGMFVLTTDTGRQLVFYLSASKDYVTDRAGNEIEGSEVYYDNASHQFEVKIPSSAIKQYKETISLGYYLDAEMDENGNVVTDQDGNQVQRQIISDVADLSQSGLGTTPNEITMDGNFGDWDSYSHHLIEYSTHDADAEGALYADGDSLMMHVQTYKASGRDQINDLYQDIRLRFNHDTDESHQINMKMLAIDANGNISYPSWQDLNQTQPGTYEYYLYDYNGWGLAGKNINNPTTFSDQWNPKHDWIYGKIIIKVTPIGTEMEVKLDMSELADRMSTKLGRTVNTQDLKYIQAHFQNIGDQWISCAGTSTGPVPGILMGAGIAVLAAWGYKKKEKGEVQA